MMYRGLLFLTAAGLMATAQANDRPPHHLQPNTLAACSPYLTETECQAHGRILTFFGDLRKRAAY